MSQLSVTCKYGKSLKTKTVSCLGKKIINLATTLLTSFSSISGKREYQITLVVDEAGKVKQCPRFPFHKTVVGELYPTGRIQSVETRPQSL